MARLSLIGLLTFFAIACFGIGFGLYRCGKRIMVNGKPLLDQPVNEQTRTDKMGIGEFAVYGSMIIITSLLAFSLMKRGGSGNFILVRFVVVPPIMALFNARKRTGKAMLAFVVAFMFALFFMIAYAIVGLPQKAPTLTINDTKIVVAETTVGSVMKKGFDIYVKENDLPRTDYKRLLSSGNFKKYPGDRSILVKKGFRRNDSAVEYSSYLLVKDGVVVGSIGVYGHKTEDVALEECKIIHFRLDRGCIDAAKANSISYRFNGIDLLASLNPEAIRKTFGKKLWSEPSNTANETSRYYGIKWTTGSNHLFWNEYYSYINFDERSNMTSFELNSEIARDE